MKKIAVFCGSSLGFNPIYREAAIELGNYFAKNNIGLIYGGGKIGMMGVLADTVLRHKGEVIGVIPELLKKKEVIHSGVKEMIICKKMSDRKVIMSKLAEGYITLPGGFGTFDELFEALTLNQLQIEQKPVGLLNTNGFFDAVLVQLDNMVAEGYLKEVNRKMVFVGASVNELMQKMNQYNTPKKIKVIQKVVRSNDDKL